MSIELKHHHEIALVGCSQLYMNAASLKLSRVVAVILLKSVEGIVSYSPKGKASLRRIGLNSGLGAISGSLLGSS